MLIRIAAALIDARLAAGRLAAAAWAALPAAWAALPAEPLARLVLHACGVRGTGRSVPLPDGGRARVVEDPRLARYLDFMPVRPFAQTVGGWIFCRTELPEATLRHELEHVRQWRRLGPLFLPAYLAASAEAALRGAPAYRGNRFEVAARSRE